MRRYVTLYTLIAMLLVAVAPAHAWLANGTPMCIATSDQSDMVAESDGQGGAYLAWTDPRSGIYQVYALHVDANGNPVTGWPFNGLAISPTQQNQTQARMAITSAGGVVLYWHENGHVQVAAFSSSATSLPATPLPFVFQGAAAEHTTRCATDDAAWIAWTEHGAGSGVQLWRPGWPSVKSMLPSTIDTGKPVLVADASGGMWISCQAVDALGDAVVLAHVQANGAWAAGFSAEGESLCTASGAQEAHVGISDGAGGAYFAWQDRRSGNPDIYATRVLANGAIAPGWTKNGTAVCAAANSQTEVHIARDAGGGLWLAWDDQRAGVGNDDIYAMALSSDGQRRSGFPVNGAAVATGALTQIMPALVSHPDGTVTVAWAQLTGGTRSFDVYAARLSQHGNVSPGANGSGVSTFANDQLQPLVVPGPGTDALVFWSDQRDLQNDLYGTRVALAAPTGVGDGAGAAAFAITRVWPQPALGGKVTLRLTLADAHAAQLALYDVAGRRVGATHTVAGAGAHDVTLDAGSAAPGLYFARVTQTGQTREARVVITR